MSWLVVDVNKFNSFNDYTAAAASVDGVLIRCGLRGYGTNAYLSKDAKLDTHYNGFNGKIALNGNNIKIGYTWFPNSISEDEATAEADYVAQLLSERQNDFPVYYISEIADTASQSGRADNLSKADRTKYALAWGNRMKSYGFRVGVYATEDWLNNNIDYDTLVNNNWSILVSKENSSIMPTLDTYDAWKYTSTGSISGSFSNVSLSNFYNDVARWDNTQIDINSLNVWVISPVAYDGNNQIIPLCGIDGLTLDVDYTVTFSNCTNVTTKAKAIFNGINNYTGTKTIEYTITQASIENVGLSLESNTYQYTGEPIKPTLVVDRSTPLGNKFVASQYSIDYFSNINPGIASMIVEAKNNYYGTKELYFNIVGIIPFPSTPTIPEYSYTYNREEIRPEVTIEGMIENVDYTLAYFNNTDAGVASILITGIGIYDGSDYTINFNILPKDISDSASINFIDGNQFFYTGNEIKPKFSVIDDNNISLLEGFEYKYSYSNNISVGRGTVNVIGYGNFKGTLTAAFNIVPYSILSANVILDSNTYQYTGEPIIPETTVTLGDKLLTKDTDYYVRCTNNVDMGTASLYIIGMGNYAGTITTYFEITSKSLPNDWILDRYQYTYTGQPYEPNPSSEQGSSLIIGIDYKIEYDDNIDVGVAYCNIVGMNNYDGNIVHIPFVILSSGIAGADFSLSSYDYTYNKTYIEPEVTCSNPECIEGVDYSITYHDNFYPQETDVIITGYGNYHGEARLPYIINRIDLSRLGEIYMGEPDEDNIYDPANFAVFANGVKLVLYDDYIYDFKTIVFPVNSSYQHTTYIVTGIGPCFGTIVGSYLTKRDGYKPDVPKYKPRDEELIDDEVIDGDTEPDSPDIEPIDPGEYVDIDPIIEPDPTDPSLIVYPSGTVLALRNVRYFSSPYNLYPEHDRITGNYFVYNWKVINGKIRVTNILDSVKIVGRTTGWIEVQSATELYNIRVGDKIKIYKYVYSDREDTSKGVINREGDYMYITEILLPEESDDSSAYNIDNMIGVADRSNQNTIGWVSLDMIDF